MNAREPWSLRAARVRGLALEPVARQLGYRRDPRNRQRWKRPGSVLALAGARFFDHACGRGGGGAIDLVMHAADCSFGAAVEFLESHFGGPAAAPLAALRARQPPDGPRLPPPYARSWPAVHEFLHIARGLDPDLLARCRRAGLLYADARGNAVFVCRDPAGAVTGAELVGTRPDPAGRSFKGLAPGSRKARGGFWLPPDRDAPAAVLLVESALDALAVHQFPPPGLPVATLVASTAGVAAAWPPWLDPWHTLPPLCGYDADPAGDRAAAALQRQRPAVRRHRPRGAKDWNELLQRSPTA